VIIKKLTEGNDIQNQVTQQPGSSDVLAERQQDELRRQQQHERACAPWRDRGGWQAAATAEAAMVRAITAPLQRAPRPARPALPDALLTVEN
jgi:hypothetical protein